MKRKRSDNREIFRALTLITQFGINMIVPIFMMSALGLFLDRKWGTRYLVVIGFFLGALAGGQSIYRMAKRYFQNPGEGEEQTERGKDHRGPEKEE